MYSPYFTNRCKFKNTKNGFTLLYEFPIASVTKDHKCSSLKELHVLFYQCGGHISKWVFRAAFFWKLWQRILSCFFQLLEAAHNLNTQKIKIMASGPITSWEIEFSIQVLYLRVFCVLLSDWTELNWIPSLRRSSSDRTLS